MEPLTHITLVMKEVHELLPAEATYNLQNNVWYVGCPGEAPGYGGIANLAGHKVIFDKQAETITVLPSILCGCGAHYFIRNNHIEWC